MVHTSESHNPVFIIMGSTRQSRHAPKIATWVMEIAQGSGLNLEIIDLADWHLPMDDEPNIPQTGQYIQEHTKAWSRKIASGSAFIFLTPQYNWGYPAPLKNALDHLYAEWSNKPAAIVSYGGHGGNKCAEQLQQVLGAMKLSLIKTQAELTLSREVIHGGPLDVAKEFAAFADSIRKAASELAAALA